jgi:hypothetical protein
MTAYFSYFFVATLDYKKKIIKITMFNLQKFINIMMK